MQYSCKGPNQTGKLEGGPPPLETILVVQQLELPNRRLSCHRIVLALELCTGRWVTCGNMEKISTLVGKLVENELQGSMSLVAVLLIFHVKTVQEALLIKPLDIKHHCNSEGAANAQGMWKAKSSAPIPCYLPRMKFQLGLGEIIPASVSLQND